MKWKKENFKIPELIQPPASPDLSPLDYWLWAEWDKLVKARQPKTLPELRAAILAAWGQLVSEYEEELKTVINNWPRRLERCVDAEGYHFEV